MVRTCPSLFKMCMNENRILVMGLWFITASFLPKTKILQRCKLRHVQQKNQIYIDANNCNTHILYTSRVN